LLLRTVCGVALVADRNRSLKRKRRKNVGLCHLRLRFRLQLPFIPEKNTTHLKSLRFGLVSTRRPPRLSCLGLASVADADYHPANRRVSGSHHLSRAGAVVGQEYAAVWPCAQLVDCQEGLAILASVCRNGLDQEQAPADQAWVLDRGDSLSNHHADLHIFTATFVGQVCNLPSRQAG
jgi:hypothetical protein